MAIFTAYDGVRWLEQKNNTFNHFNKLFDDDLVKNLHRIHPLHQKQVHELVLLISEDKDINQRLSSMYIFGSSLMKRCDYMSDFDLAVNLFYDNKVQDGLYYETEVVIKIRKLIGSVMKKYSSHFDLLSLNDISYWKDDNLYKNIVEKGVLIYGCDDR